MPGVYSAIYATPALRNTALRIHLALYFPAGILEKVLQSILLRHDEYKESGSKSNRAWKQSDQYRSHRRCTDFLSNFHVTVLRCTTPEMWRLRLRMHIGRFLAILVVYRYRTKDSGRKRCCRYNLCFASRTHPDEDSKELWKRFVHCAISFTYLLTFHTHAQRPRERSFR